MTARSWSDDDDLVAMYLYRHGSEQLGATIDEAASRIGRSAASLRMRIANFKAYYTGSGLKNYGVRPARLDRQFGKLSEPELRERVRQHLRLVRSRRNTPEEP